MLLIKQSFPARHDGKTDEWRTHHKAPSYSVDDHKLFLARRYEAAANAAPLSWLFLNIGERLLKMAREPCPAVAFLPEQEGESISSV